MSQLQVYMVLYQYCEQDYSVITIMTTLEKAYLYICQQKHQFDSCKLIEVVDDNVEFDKDYTNICYYKSTDYYSFDTLDKDYVSPYIIVPMKVN